MKQGIHPKYETVKVTCTTCGSVFETGSVLGEIRVQIVTHSIQVNKHLLKQMVVLKSSTNATV